MVQTGKDSITLVAVGDIRLARKDYKLSFKKVANIIRTADISFFHCGTIYADNGIHSPMPSYQRAWRDREGNFAKPTPNDPSNMSALTLAGFNVCSLATNQSLDWGIDALAQCSDRLQAMGIAVCGFGRDISEARRPAIVETNGVKVAFLGYLSAGHYEYKADVSKSGVAVIRAHTVYEPPVLQPGAAPRILTWPHKEDLQCMREDIEKAREQADIVVVTDQWGMHTPVAIPDYEWDVGHAAIDAGADLVLGIHPHILKAIEVYKGKAILHSLGKLALEEHIASMEGAPITPRLKSRIENETLAWGPRSPDDQKSIILKCVISGHRIKRLSYIPVMLEDDANPEPMASRDPRAQDVINYVQDISRRVGLSTEFSLDGDEVVIGL